MKKKFIICISLLLPIIVYTQSVAINDDGSPPNPGAMLDIKSTTKGLLIPRMTTTQRNALPNVQGLLVFDTDLGRFYSNSGVGWVELASGGATNYWSASGNNIFKNNTGYVGIGLSSPLANLDVARGTSSYGTAMFRGTTHISHFNYSTNEDTYIRGGKDGSLVILNDAVQLTRQGAMYISGTIPFVDITHNGQQSGRMEGSNANLELNAFRPNVLGTQPGNLIIQADYLSQFVNYYSGNVGIGVTNPAYKLDIGSRIRLRSGSALETAGLWLNNPDNSGGIAFIGTATPTVVGIYGSGSSWGLIMNTNTGNVGIGTLNPTYKLSVNGNIRSKEVVVETGWADYVFQRDYRLKPLTEVEEFINKHQHLPGIPSAAELEETGLSVGDMQRKMMEKIEELTLYIIELKKDLESLRAKK